LNSIRLSAVRAFILAVVHGSGVMREAGSGRPKQR
jgi:hypothetical protein